MNIKKPGKSISGKHNLLTYYFKSQPKGRNGRSQALILILFFILLILIGTGLLMLPAMSIPAGGMSFLEALFTSVSATCVTGLQVVDTSTFLSSYGQWVILALIQLGGLAIVGFASFFSFYPGGKLKLPINHKDYYSSPVFKERLKRILIIAFIIEFGTFALLYLTWNDQVLFESIPDKIFYSLFHAVSAFCNAGFTLFSENLHNLYIRNAYILQIVLVIAVILGSIGFDTIEDLFSPKALRERLKTPSLDYRPNTKVSLFISGGLLALGMLLIYVFEKDAAFKQLNFMESLIASFFHSGTIRSAGFYTVDIVQLQSATLITFLLLMLIGGSSYSFAGGIKTSTLYALIGILRKGDNIRNRGMGLVAFSIFTFTIIFNLSLIFILNIVEPNFSLSQLAFEQISAFSTVGLSTGITSSLHDISKVLLIISMFTGRLSTLTIVFVVGQQAFSSSGVQIG